MAVRIENTFQVKESIQRVWELLSDPRQVVACVPGAQVTDAVDESTFKGAISVKVGPSVTAYTGQVHIERLDAEAHEIELVGKGQDVRGKGSASMKMTGKLRSLPDGGTEVSAVSEITVVGLMAQLGSRMIQDVSAVIFKEFVKRFQQQLQQDPAAARPATSATPEPVQALGLVGSAIGEAVRRTFHRKPGGAEES